MHRHELQQTQLLIYFKNFLVFRFLKKIRALHDAMRGDAAPLLDNLSKGATRCLEGSQQQLATRTRLLGNPSFGPLWVMSGPPSPTALVMV
jgi:hypothetical protein